MCNRYESHTHVGPSRIDVHEHRAPTDDSVRLLREMEDKARANVVATLVAHDNKIEGTVARVRDQTLRRDSIVAHFTLNGERYERVIAEIPMSAQYDPDAAFKALRETLANAIAAKLLAEHTIEWVTH